jgi:hypothetical protein
MRGDIFSLGGLLSRVWTPAFPLLPWAFTSAMLMMAGTWDHLSRGGPVDYTVVGLAAFELMIGLLDSGEREEQQARLGEARSVGRRR